MRFSVVLLLLLFACVAPAPDGGPSEDDETPPLVCNIGNYESDGECIACSAGTYCAGGDWPRLECPPEGFDHDLDATTLCIYKAECAAGTHVDDPGSTTKDRTCAACGEGTFAAAANQGACSAFRACAAGEYEAGAGTPTSDRLCFPCGEGSYSTIANATTCDVWTPCAAGEHVATAGTTIMDQTCAACANGTFTARTNEASCAQWTTCVPGQYVDVAGTAARDQGCYSCFTGTFTSAPNQPSCTPWSVCSPARYEASPGSGTTDRTCALLPPLTLVDVDAGPAKQAGQRFGYRLTYSCVASSCVNAEIVDLLPPELAWIDGPPAPSGDIAAVTVTPNYLGGGRTRVQVVLATPLAAGAEGAFVIGVEFPNGSTPNETIATNTADFINLGASPGTTTTAPVGVTGFASTQVVLAATLQSAPATLDATESYRLRITNLNNASGSLDLTAIGPLTDTLEPGAVFGGATPAADCEPGCVGTTGATLAWASPCALPLTPGQDCDVTVSVTYPSVTFSAATNVSNGFVVTATPRGRAAQTFGPTGVTHPLQ